MDLNEQYEAYRNRSGDELWETLLSLTAEQKRSGEMSSGKMEEIYAMLSPMLSDAQRRRMREIIDRLNAPM